MPGPGEQFLALLRDERDAARRADVDALVALQEQKARFLEVLRAAPLPEEQLGEISALAASNLELLRHLVGSLRAMLEPDPPQGYNASGALSSQAARGSVLRGSL